MEDHLERFRIYVPEQTAIIPRDGEVKVNRWWVYKHGMGLLAIKWGREDISISYQCNTNKQWIVDKTIAKLYPDHNAIFMPIVFLRHFYDLEPAYEPKREK